MSVKDSVQKNLDEVVLQSHIDSLQIRITDTRGELSEQKIRYIKCDKLNTEELEQIKDKQNKQGDKIKQLVNSQEQLRTEKKKFMKHCSENRIARYKVEAQKNFRDERAKHLEIKEFLTERNHYNIETNKLKCDDLRSKCQMTHQMSLQNFNFRRQHQFEECKKEKHKVQKKFKRIVDERNFDNSMKFKLKKMDHYSSRQNVSRTGEDNSPVSFLRRSIEGSDTLSFLKKSMATDVSMQHDEENNGAYIENMLKVFKKKRYGNDIIQNDHTIYNAYFGKNPIYSKNNSSCLGTSLKQQLARERFTNQPKINRSVITKSDSQRLHTE